MKEMKEIFYQNAYQREFDAEVLTCKSGKRGWGIVLSETAFYPEGGGQPGDRGFLNDVPVTDTRKKEDYIVHYTAEKIPVGAKVHGAIDWERRFDYMQNHSGEHIYSGLVHQRFGFDNVGFHMSEETVTIDFNGSFTMDQALEIEKEANRIIYDNEETHIFFPNKEELVGLEYRSKKELSGVIRIVEFKGADICACCGTHVKRTGEIGIIKVLSLIRHKCGVRLQIICGERALAYFDKTDKANTEISRLFSSKPDETVEAVRHFINEQNKLKEKLNAVHQKYFQSKSELLMPASVVITIEEGMTMMEIRKFCEYLTETEKGNLYVVLTPDSKGGYHYAIGSRSINVKEKVTGWNKNLNGKGGGKADIVQGSFYTDLEHIKRILLKK